MPPVTMSKEQALEEVRSARAALEGITADLDAARERQGRVAMAAQDAGATLTEIGSALGLSKQRAFDVIAEARDRIAG